ncbi:MAG: dicarboxylate/amino acid:cation symporter [Bacteroidales bacterium]|nr:dicarboxylate/amino acid:cation symporter [Bacteroidales bacterium]
MPKRLPLWLKIIAGMILGFAWGMIAVKTGLEKFTEDWVVPWGNILLKLLKLIAIPLIFVSLVKGISSITDISRLSRIGLKTVGIFFISTFIATALGLLVANTVKPGITGNGTGRSELSDTWDSSLSNKVAGEEAGPLRFFEEIVPDNVFGAIGDNSKMLQIILFSMLFGIAMVLVPGNRVRVVADLFDNLYDIILRLVGIVMSYTPLGVFGLMAGVVVSFSGDTAVFLALGKYFITVMLGMLMFILVIYPLYIKLFAGDVKVMHFLKSILPAQIVAFSTSSSAAALPVTMRQNINELEVPEEISSFVLPVGTTINMDATAFYQSVAAVFIAQVYGIDMTFSQQIALVMTATLTSIGSPGVPGGIIVLMIMVLTAAGLPVEGMALIVGIDRPIDMLRSAVNLTGDSAVNLIVAKSEKNFQPASE